MFDYFYQVLAIRTINSFKMDPQRKAERRKTLWEDARNVPNLLTFSRILMVPAVLYFLSRGTQKDCFYSAIIYAISAITDFFDGWLARRQGLVSMVGKFLDPLADKISVISVLIWLIPMNRISAWIVIVLILRELAITSLRSIASSEGLVISAQDGGKIKTALQMIGIISLILGYAYHLNFGIDFGVVNLIRVGNLLILLSLIFSLTSAASYLNLFIDTIEQKYKTDGTENNTSP